MSQLLISDWEACDEHNGYTLQVPTQHPFIAILNQEKHSWKSVLNQMELIMRYHDKRYVLDSSIITFHFSKTNNISRFSFTSN